MSPDEVLALFPLQPSRAYPELVSLADVPPAALPPWAVVVDKATSSSNGGVVPPRYVADVEPAPNGGFAPDPRLRTLDARTPAERAAASVTPPVPPFSLASSSSAAASSSSSLPAAASSSSSSTPPADRWESPSEWWRRVVLKKGNP